MWEHEWKELSKRLDAWSAIADAFLRHIEQAPGIAERANKALAHEANEIVDAIGTLELPAPVKAEVDQVKQRLDSMLTVNQGERVVVVRWITLAALRIPLDKAARTTEIPRRRLVDRAFLHLNRTLTVDEDARRKWIDAFEEGETRCEQLGALHLLAHGIYAFKADAGSGRTDLILGDRVSMSEDVRAAETMVLTEWKLVRDGDSTNEKAIEGREQAKRYAANELAAFELRSHRYVVLVSERQVVAPASDIDGAFTYHYINIAIEPDRPSVASRRQARRQRRTRAIARRERGKA